MSQSVYLNLNTNFSNHTAPNYTQYFDNPLEVPKNSKVCLYNAELKKAPITITQDQSFKLFIDSATDSSKAFVLHNTDSSLVDNNDLNNLTVDIKKGNYSKRQFLDHLQTQAKASINANNTDSSKPRIPYKFCISNENDRIFAGLSPNFKTSDFIGKGTEAEFRNKNVSFTDTANVSTAVRVSVNAGVDLENKNPSIAECNVWAMNQSAVNPLIFGRHDNDKISKLQGNIFFNMFDADASNLIQTNIGCCFLRTSDVEAQKSGTNLGCVATSDGLAQVPKSFFGFQVIERYDEEQQITPTIDTPSRLQVFGNYYGTDIGSTNLESMVKLYDVEINSINENQRFGVSIYYENEENPIDLTANKFYFRIHHILPSQDYITTPNQLNNVIFDSKSVDYELPQALISQCFKYEQSGSMLQPYYSGLVPTFYAFCENGRGRTTSFNEEIGWADVSGNYIYDSTQSDVDNRDTVGLLKYSLTDLGDDVKEVLGNNEIVAINPNGWDRVQTSDFGITELYGDTTNYNIELSNLPIKANQSTESVNNNIGTTRPIVFQVNNAFSGSINNVNSAEMIRSIYPPQLKELSLNNVNPLKLNSINVKIKRAKDNSQATELTDAKLEIIIKEKEFYLISYYFFCQSYK